MLDDGDELEEVGARVVDGLSRALGGKAVIPVAFSVLPQYMADATNWQRRRAAILASALLGEGCGVHMYAQLPNVVPNLVNFCADSHHRVRSAALHCIGQMSMDFPGGKTDAGGKKQKSYQNTFHSLVVPALIASLEPEGINAQVPPPTHAHTHINPHTRTHTHPSIHTHTSTHWLTLTLSPLLSLHRSVVPSRARTSGPRGLPLLRS
jgi:hypothetical protein